MFELQPWITAVAYVLGFASLVCLFISFHAERRQRFGNLSFFMTQVVVTAVSLAGLVLLSGGWISLSAVASLLAMAVFVVYSVGTGAAAANPPC